MCLTRHVLLLVSLKALPSAGVPHISDVLCSFSSTIRLRVTGTTSCVCLTHHVLLLVSLKALPSAGVPHISGHSYLSKTST